MFRFFSYGLEIKFRREIYRDFEDFTLQDFNDGILLLFICLFSCLSLLLILPFNDGLEKFWGFVKYYKVEHCCCLLVCYLFIVCCLFVEK